METRPDDVMARVWYGMVQLSGGQTEQAEKTMLDAVKAVPQDDRTWNGLFTFYVRTDNKPKARETLQQMMSQAKMTKERSAFVLAQGYESLGDDVEAEAAYRQAFEEFPDNRQIRARLARFLLEPGGNQRIVRSTGDRRPAARSCSEIHRTARRMGTLAVLLASEGGSKFQEALKLLNQSEIGKDAANRRMEGILLFQRSGPENLAAARKIFEALLASPDAELNDHLRLARILEQQGDLPAARAQLSRLAEQQPPNVQALAFYIDFLIRRQDLNEAQRWLPTLQEASKGNSSLGVLGLQARAAGSPRPGLEHCRPDRSLD